VARINEGATHESGCDGKCRQPIVRICDLDQDHPEYAELEFETQADANAAVTQLNEIFQKAILITFKRP
jgi:hypothetical protein